MCTYFCKKMVRKPLIVFWNSLYDSMMPFLLIKTRSSYTSMNCTTGFVIVIRVHSHAPSIRSHRGIKVVWPDFQPMRAPEEPVCVHLFRQKPVFTSLHLKSPVHVHRLWTLRPFQVSWPVLLLLRYCKTVLIRTLGDTGKDHKEIREMVKQKMRQTFGAGKERPQSRFRHYRWHCSDLPVGKKLNT